MGRKSFTLTELLVVIIILGVVAGFSLPQYQKMIDRNYEKQGINSLQMIYAAEQAYEAEHNEVWPTDSSIHYIDDINANLHLNIMEEGFTYNCLSTSTTEFKCYATHTGRRNFTLRINESGHICCNGTTCPTASCCSDTGLC